MCVFKSAILIQYIENHLLCVCEIDSSSEVGTEFRYTPEGARPDDTHLPDKIKVHMRTRTHSCLTRLRYKLNVKPYL